MRRIALGVAIALWWLMLAAWCLGMGLGTPWSPAQVRVFTGTALASVMGKAQVDAAGLRVDGLGDYRQGLQSWQPSTPLQAEDYRILHYRVDDFPRTLELDLIVRNEDDPADVVVQPLPWPRNGAGSFDLTTLPEWHGRILEIGFSEIDAAGQLPPGIAAPPFTLVGMRLESRSWRGALALLASNWFGYQPWTMSMINTVRADNDVTLRCSPVLLLASGMSGSLLLAALVGGIRRRRLAVLALLLAAVAWVALDLLWLAQSQQRDAVTRAVFQGRPWSERAGMQFDLGVYQRAVRMRDVLEHQTAGRHVLLWAPDKAQAIRLGWFLRPFNISLLNYGTPPERIPDGTLLMIDNSDGLWSYDHARSLLDHGTFRLHGDLVYRGNELMLLSVRKGAGS